MGKSHGVDLETLESAADSDIMWETFLPQDYKSLVPEWREFSSKKELYFNLCNNPVPINDGKKRLWLEKASGKRCIILPAMDLGIAWGDNLKYWRWVPEARFGMIAELIEVCWFGISGSIDTRLLSPATRYSAYIVFKKGDAYGGFKDIPVEAIITELTHKERSRRLICFDEATYWRNIVKPEERKDGWMEVELGGFFTDEVLYSNEIEICVLDNKTPNWKKGLIILGIEIRPASNAERKDDSEVVTAIPSETYRTKQSCMGSGEKLGVIIIGCLLLLYFCLQRFTITPLLSEGVGAVNRNVMDIPKVLKYIPPERTEIAIYKDSEIVMDIPKVLEYISPERTEIAIYKDSEIVMDIPKVLEYIPPERTEVAIYKASEIVMDIPKVLEYIPPERTEVAKYKASEIVLDVPKVVEYIPPERTEIAIDNDSEIVMDLPEVLEYIPPEITIDKDSDSLTDDGAKPEKFCSLGAKTNSDLLDSKDKTFGIKQHFKELGENLDLSKIEQGMIIGCLLLLFFCLRYITYAFVTLLGKDGGAINRNVVDVSKVLEHIPVEGIDNTTDKSITCGAKPVISSSDAKTNADLLDSGKDGGAINRNVVDVSKVLEHIPVEGTDNTTDKSFTCGAKPVISSSDAKTNADLLDSGKDGGAINRNVVDVSKVLECIPPEQTTDDTIDKSIIGGAKPERFKTKKKKKKKPVRSSSDTKTNADLLDSKITPSQIQVFVSFRGIQLRNNFVGYLVKALQRGKVNVYIDSHEPRGEDLNTLFKRIEDSGIAIVVFSTRYTESKWCLEELVKIKERVHQGLLKVLPIFYKVSPTDVKRLKGKFGDNFRDKEHEYGSDSPVIKAWKEAIVSVTHKHAMVYDEKSGALENDFVETIVKEVLQMLQSVSIVDGGQSSR